MSEVLLTSVVLETHKIYSSALKVLHIFIRSRKRNSCSCEVFVGSTVIQYIKIRDYCLF